MRFSSLRSMRSHRLVAVMLAATLAVLAGACDSRGDDDAGAGQAAESDGGRRNPGRATGDGGASSGRGGGAGTGNGDGVASRNRTGGGGSETGDESETGDGPQSSDGSGTGSRRTGETLPPRPQPKRPAGWRSLAPAPLEGRHSHSMVWTGREVIVWGGATRAGNAPIYFDDGAAYDPASDRWRTLAPSRLSPRADHVAAWTGTEMLVWGGNPGNPTPYGKNEFTDGALYNPVTERWRPMATFPLHGRFAAAVVWTGELLVVWGGARAEHGDDPPPLADGAAYDPDTNRWSRLPDAPIAGRLFPLAAAVDGDVLISWGFTGPGSPPAFDGARYDPDTERWTPVAPAPESDDPWCFDLAGCVGVDTGNRVVFAGEGLVYDPAADRWAKVETSPLANPVLDGKALAWTGRRVVLWGGGRYPDESEAPSPPEQIITDPAGMAYDPAGDSWARLPAAPIASRARTAGVWTGAEFVVWGGESDYTVRTQYADGAAWTP